MQGYEDSPAATAQAMRDGHYHTGDVGIDIRADDVEIEGPGAHVRCTGKGRKERATPLRKETVAVLRAWLREQGGQPTDPLFPSQRGGFMSRDAVEKRVHKHASKAAACCPSLPKKRVSPHVLRHTRAVRMLEAGNDSAVIALWLGHESVETTHVYLAADLAAKETKVFKIKTGERKPARYTHLPSGP